MTASYKVSCRSSNKINAGSVHGFSLYKNPWSVMLQISTSAPQNVVFRPDSDTGYNVAFYISLLSSVNADKTGFTSKHSVKSERKII